MQQNRASRQKGIAKYANLVKDATASVQRALGVQLAVKEHNSAGGGGEL